jgi:hypothetical protein
MSALSSHNPAHMNMLVLKIPPITKQHGKIKGIINTVVGLVRQNNPMKDKLGNHSTTAWK